MTMPERKIANNSNIKALKQLKSAQKSYNFKFEKLRTSFL